MTKDKSAGEQTLAGGTLLDPDEIVARMTPDKRKTALWQRRDVVTIFAPEYRKELLRQYVIDGGSK